VDDLASGPGDGVTSSAARVAWIRPAARLGAVFGAFLVVCAALTGGLTAWVEHRGGQAAVTGRAPSTSATAVADMPGSSTRVAAVRPLVDRRADAVRTGSRAGWAATVDDSAASREFRTRQLAEFDRLRLLPIRAWRYELVETALLGDVSGAETFTARVRLAYRLAGDSRDVERVQVFTVARRGVGWVVTGVRREGSEADPWDLGRLTVQNGRRGVVVGIGTIRSGLSLRRTAQELDEAAAQVDKVWGADWPRTVVVLVPENQDGMVTLLGKNHSTGLDQVAAVTNGELGRDPAAASTAPTGSADRVIINPEAFGRLSAVGRRVVLTHELTHVATRAKPRTTVPLWVEEGFANYVAYRDSGLARDLVAEDVQPLVRAGTAEEHLPDDGAFDPANGAIAPAYADAWLAFDLMARDGARRPLDFYRAATGMTGGASPPPPAVPSQAVRDAFQRVLGTDQAGFEARWRSYRAAVFGGSAR
jgi:hypothetical protein